MRDADSVARFDSLLRVRGGHAAEIKVQVENDNNVLVVSGEWCEEARQR